MSNIHLRAISTISKYGRLITAFKSNASMKKQILRTNRWNINKEPTVFVYVWLNYVGNGHWRSEWVSVR